MNTKQESLSRSLIARTIAALAITTGVWCSPQMALPRESGNSSAQIVTSWSQVTPTSGTRESPNVYRSGQVTDIDVSSPGSGTAVTTAWGGHFLGGLLAFMPRSDTIPTGKTRSIARYPANGDIAVIATGSSPSNGADDWGLGLYYTANGGRLWEKVVEAGNYSGAWRFEKVRWGSGNTVFAVSNRGVYRSEMNGAPNTWRRVYGYSPSGYTRSEDVLDIAVDPELPTRVYVVTGDGSLRRSTDSGSTWFPMALPLTKRDGSTFDRTRIMRGTRIAIPKLNARNVYLMIADPPGIYGMFHSTNYGDGHWTADDPGTCRVLPDMRFSGLAASPTDNNRLLAVGESHSQACLSTNGGTTWSTMGPGANSLHLDYRAVVFSSNGTAFIGGDGGIFISTDGGIYWSTIGSLILPAPTLVSFDLSAANPGYLYMATWDTGLWANNGGSYWVSAHQDTTDIEADPTNPLRAWGAVGQNGADRFATVDGGLHFDPINGNLGTSPTGSVTRTNGRTSLLTTHGRAVYSTRMPTTPRPSGGIPVPYWSRFPQSSTPDFSGVVAGLTVNRPGNSVPLIMYAWISRNSDGSLPNKLYVYDSSEDITSIGGNTWRSSGGDITSTSAVARIGTSPNGRLAYAITDNNNIWTSSDHGAHWTNVTGNAPSGMMDVLIDPTNPSHVFVATTHGICRSITPGVWSDWSRGLPFVDGAGAHVSQLRAIASAGSTYLYAGIQGRGIFRRIITSDP